jgi:formylglycine-generating enzyme required for sulfatase activity
MFRSALLFANLLCFIIGAAKVEEDIRPAVAILDLEGIKCDKDTALAASEILRTEIGGIGAFRIIERTQLDKVMREQKFSYSELVDPKYAARIGKLLGAKYVSVGSVSRLGTTYTVSIRFIDVETAEMVLGDSLTCKNESGLPELSRKLANEILNIKGASTISGTDSSSEGENMLESRIVGPGIKIIKIQSGSFFMGSNEGENDQKPVHEVLLGSSWIGETEVTVGQYSAFLNETKPNDKQKNQWILIDKSTHINNEKGRYFAEPGWENNPIVNVSWDGAKAFCEHYELRLPTEAEWEYAAGGNFHLKWSLGNIFEAKNYCCERNKGIQDPPTKIVKSYSSNSFGLYDMSGNVSEWCNDWYGNYQNEKQNDPQGAENGGSKVIKGGSWNKGFLNGQELRCAYRDGASPGFLSTSVGFRCAGD